MTRENFSAGDLQSGRSVHFVQNENSSLGPVVYRISIEARTRTRLVFKSVNISPFPVVFLDGVKSGGFEQFYVIERETDTVWRYYGLVRAQINHAFLAPSHGSSKNRTSAYFRHLAGIRTDIEPPAAKE